MENGVLALVAVCDDEKEQLAKFQQLLEELGKKEQFEVAAYISANKLLEAVREDKGRKIRKKILVKSLDREYFYWDYSLIFYFKGYGDDHDMLERMYYKSAKSLEESVEIEEADDYEPDKWVEYNKACEAYR